MLLGRCDLDQDGRAVPRTLTRGLNLWETGVTTDDSVRAGALAMLLSVLLYGFVQACPRSPTRLTFKHVLVGCTNWTRAYDCTIWARACEMHYLAMCF